MEQEYEGEKVKELILIYSERQETMVSMDNIQLDDKTSTYTAFLKGAEDIFNDADFFALRIGTFQLDDSKNIVKIDCQTSKFKVKLQQPIQEASKEEIEMFLAEKNYSFLQYFMAMVIRILPIIPNLYGKLLQFDAFDKELFHQRLMEICNGLPPEMLSRLINELENMKASKEGIIGYVTNIKSGRVEIVTKDVFDANIFPMLSIECGENKIAVAIVESVEGRKVTGNIIYAISAKELVGSSISIIQGYPVRHLKLNDIEIALRPETTSKVSPILIPVGKIIGIYDEDGKLMTDPSQEIICDFSERAKGKKQDIPGEYKIALVPGELSNGIIIGSSGSGKSNGIKVFITGVLVHNKYDTDGKKCGLLVFDRDGEYSGMFSHLKGQSDAQKSEYADYFQIVNVNKDNMGKFRLEEIYLEEFANETAEDSYDQDLKIVLKYLYENSLSSTKPDNYKPNHPVINIQALNFLLDTDRMNGIKPALEDEKNVHPARLDALLRRVNRRINILEPILQIRKNDKDVYEVTGTDKGITKLLFKAQQEGLILILDISQITNMHTYSLFSKMVQSQLKFYRGKWFTETLESSGGDQFAFANTAPLFLRINEEATSLFAGISNASELTTHIAAATGDRKYNMGTVYVFQTLEGISTNIKLILTQLGGFSVMFSVTMNHDRKLAIENVNIQEAESMDDFIRNAKRFKLSVTSCETYANRPFFVKFYKAEEYFKNLFKIKVPELTDHDKEYLKEKEARKDEPKDFGKQKKTLRENDFKQLKK
jgi:hypothetical protein